MNRFQKIVSRMTGLDREITDARLDGHELGRKAGLAVGERIGRAAVRQEATSMAKVPPGRKEVRPGVLPQSEVEYAVDLGDGEFKILITGDSGLAVAKAASFIERVIRSEISRQSLGSRLCGCPDCRAMRAKQDATGAPQASAAPDPAGSPPEPPIASEAGSGAAEGGTPPHVAAMVGSTPWGEKVYAFGMHAPCPPAFGPDPVPPETEAELRRLENDAARRILGGAHPLADYLSRIGEQAEETAAAALRNITTAAQATAGAAPEDPPAPTLTATLAGVRAAEEAVGTALINLE